VAVSKEMLAELTDSGIGAFVTGDAQFMSEKKAPAEMIGMPTPSPKGYVEGLGLG